MKPETDAHLARADHHREVARALIGPHGLSISRTPPLDWAAVAAFYAAVHFVNAYLWEKLQQDPGDHQTRTAAIARLADLRAIQAPYAYLTGLGYQARYARRFQVARSDVERAVFTNLEQVRGTVLQALGLTP